MTKTTQHLLTFEMSPNGTLEIHGDRMGLIELVKLVQHVLAGSQHEHLMSASWGGDELSEDKQGDKNRLINSVKIMLWPDAK